MKCDCDESDFGKDCCRLDWLQLTRLAEAESLARRRPLLLASCPMDLRKAVVHLSPAVTGICTPDLLRALADAVEKGQARVEPMSEEEGN